MLYSVKCVRERERESSDFETHMRYSVKEKSSELSVSKVRTLSFPILRVTVARRQARYYFGSLFLFYFDRVCLLLQHFLSLLEEARVAREARAAADPSLQHLDLAPCITYSTARCDQHEDSLV